jgi:hypothetical protein
MSEIEDPYSQVQYLMDGCSNLDRRFLSVIKRAFEDVRNDFV